MKNFEVPEIVTLDLTQTENGPQGSGVTFDKNEPPVISTDEWTVDAYWTSHNSGSHSELHIQATHHGSHGGGQVTFKIQLEKFTLIAARSGDENCICIVDGSKNLTVVRKGKYNATENIGFNVILECSDGPVKDGHHGAYGDTERLQRYDPYVKCIMVYGN